MASKSKRHKVAPYDSAGYLKTEADIKNYLEAVFEAPSGSADADSHARRCCSSARHDEALKGHRHHPRRPLQGSFSKWKSELRDRDEDRRCIRHATERASSLNGK